MKEFLVNTFKGDRVLWIVFVALLAFSSVEMYSASSTLAFKHANYFSPVWSHIVFLCVGFLVAYITHILPRNLVMYASPCILLFALVFLLITLLSGHAVNGANRWTTFMGLNFQPSELGKLALVLNLAILLQFYNHELFFTKKTTFWVSIGLTSLVVGLIFTENFSTAFLSFTTAMTMMFCGRIPLKWLVGVMGSLVVAVALFFLVAMVLPSNPVTHRAKVWVQRIEDFSSKTQEEDKFKVDDKNFQAVHAKIALSNSNFVGRGIGNSIERDILPLAFADFIYSIIIEELGIAGGVLVVLLYLIVLYRAAKIAQASESVYSALLVLGLATMIVLQAFINMAVAVGIIPITGQPLPLISRGGTSIIITCAYFGIMLGVSRMNDKKATVAVKKEKKKDE